MKLDEMILIVLALLVSNVFSYTFPDDVVLPSGFTISKYFDPNDLTSVNGLQTLSDSGITFEKPRTIRTEVYNGSTIVYVGTKSTSDKYLYALIDYDNDASIDQIFAIFESTNSRGPAQFDIDPLNYYIYINAQTTGYVCECNVHATVLSFDTARIDERLPNCREWIEFPSYTWYE